MTKGYYHQSDPGNKYQVADDADNACVEMAVAKETALPEAAGKFTPGNEPSKSLVKILDLGKGGRAKLPCWRPV